MCILLFNKKIKLDKLTEIMTTKLVVNAKPDTKITVPENYFCLVYYKDCFLFSLEHGEYKLDDVKFSPIINKNKRRNKKVKRPRYNFNLHYITCKNLDIIVQFKALTSFKEKCKYGLSANYSIFNPKTFAKELLVTWYKTTNNRTLSYINNWFKEFAEYFIRKYDKNKLNHTEELKSFSNKFFRKYGISINDISISVNQEIKKSNFFEPQINEQTTKKIEQPTISLPASNSNVNSNTYNIERYCPKCQTKIIKGSAYCIKCGQSISTDITFK